MVRFVTRLCSLLVLVMAQLAVSCGNGTSEDAVSEDDQRPAPSGAGLPQQADLPQPPSDIPEPVRGQLMLLAEDLVSALCERAESCCVQLGTSPNENCVAYAAMVWRKASHMRDAAPEDANMEYAFDEARAAACRSRLAQLSMGCRFELERTDPADVTALLVLESYCSAALSVSMGGAGA